MATSRNNRGIRSSRLRAVIVAAGAWDLVLGFALPFYTIGVFSPLLFRGVGWRYDQIMVA